MAYIDQFIY